MSPKKLLKIEKKWEKSVSSSRRRIAMAGACVELDSTSPLTEKGYFIIYTADRSRFMVSLQCLRGNIFQELFKMSEEEFGLLSDGPITVPCDAASMEYNNIACPRCIAKDTEKALLNSIAFLDAQLPLRITNVQNKF